MNHSSHKLTPPTYQLYMCIVSIYPTSSSWLVHLSHQQNLSLPKSALADNWLVGIEVFVHVIILLLLEATVKKQNKNKNNQVYINQPTTTNQPTTIQPTTTNQPTNQQTNQQRNPSYYCSMQTDKASRQVGK